MRRIVGRFVAKVKNEFSQIKILKVIQTENNKYYVEEEASNQLTEIQEDQIIREK